jgi:hypothetical protein
VSFTVSAWECADNSRPMSFNVSARERVYATNLSRLQREARHTQRETSKQHVGEAHRVLIAAILFDWICTLRTWKHSGKTAWQNNWRCY